MASSKDAKAALLDLYHRKAALSCLPNGYAPYFQLGRAQWGYGLIDDSGDTELLEDIPSDLSALESVFATSKPTYTYINGKIVIVATLPRSAIPDGETRKFSMLGILDADEELVGAVVVNTQTLTNKMDVSVTLEINTVDDKVSLDIAG